MQRMILVIDDNTANLRLLKEILQSKYKVYAAPSGDFALTFLEKKIPDLILLDIEMPGLSGYEVIQRLKSETRWRDIPVIFLTAQEGRDKEEQAFSLGAVDYILKPISIGVVLARVELHLELVTYRKSLERLVEQKTKQLEATQNAILDILANVTSYRDNETGGHIMRTTIYSKLLVENLWDISYPGYIVTQQYGNFIIKSAKLHDIGKVAISDTILLKPTRLSNSEFEFIKMHTNFGAQMIDNAIHDLGDDSFLGVAREIVISHHEWWDGNGYPYKLKGTQIPLSARIMAIADVYDALISHRPYKPPFTHEAAIEIIMNESGTHFDPELIKISERTLKDFELVAQQYSDEKFSIQSSGTYNT